MAMVKVVISEIAMMSYVMSTVHIGHHMGQRKEARLSFCSHIHLEVPILPGEEGDAPVDGQAQQVGRHSPLFHSQQVEVTSQFSHTYQIHFDGILLKKTLLQHR